MTYTTRGIRHRMTLTPNPEHPMTEPKRTNPNEPTRQEQKEQQRDPGLQSYTSGGGDDRAADPEINPIVENDPRYKNPKSGDDKLR